jgi:hypothetical protein
MLWLLKLTILNWTILIFLDAEILLSISAGLITMDEESDTVRLVHYTQEYLETMRKELLPNAEVKIARVCLTYLSFNVFKSGPCGSKELLNDRLEKY